MAQRGIRIESLLLRSCASLWPFRSRGRADAGPRLLSGTTQVQLLSGAHRMANRASAPGSSRKRCDPATRVGVQVVSHPPLSISPDSSKGERPAHARQTVEHYHVGRPFPFPLDSSKAERPADFRRTGERYLVERPFMDTSLNSISPRLSIEGKRGQHPPYPPLFRSCGEVESHVSAKDEPRVRLSAGTPFKGEVQGEGEK